MNTIKLPCPYCNNGFYTVANIMSHVVRFCKCNDNTKTKAEILLQYFDQQQLNEILEKYQNGYSINELKKIYSIKRKIIELLLSANNIKIRNVKESSNCERCLTARQNTCEQKYGSGIKNPSQADEVKQKKANTCLIHYGVDNIRKYKPLYDYITELCLKRYGKKRLSGRENKSAQEIEDIEKRRQEARVRNGLYDSMLEERIDNIMTQNGIEHKRCFWAFHHPYDFIFGDHILLEVNGDYWHANPKIYKASDIMINGKTAQEIWDYDAKFRDCLKGTKFKIVYLWESDINEMTDRDIINWIQECIYENQKNKETQ